MVHVNEQYICKHLKKKKNENIKYMATHIHVKCVYFCLNKLYFTGFPTNLYNYNENISSSFSWTMDETLFEK